MPGADHLGQPAAGDAAARRGGRLSRLAAAAGSLAIALALGLSTAAQLRSDEQKPAPAPAADTPPAAGDAPPAASAPTKRVTPGPQIEIESKFIEIMTAAG